TSARALDERRAFSCTVPGDDVEERFVYLAPLFHGDAALGVAVLMMSAPGQDGDRETVLTLFSALCELVGSHVHAARQHENLVELNKRLAGSNGKESMPLVGRSASMAALRSLIYEAARTPLNVLVTGETGTGKELIARAVHQNSARADKPYIVVNCAAIPSNLFESELFGHERGAFTGAQGAKRGLLSLADGGILFLDEVGDLSPENQARILRVLEQGTFRPVGATKEEQVDVRFVGATSRTVEDEAFRDDLYYRLAGFALHAVPLRERVGDIPILAQYFMDLMASGDERLIHILSEDAIGVLSGYYWPGNVRQLRNTIERIAHRTATPLINAEDIWRDGHITRRPTASDGPLSTLAEMEREHILKVLRNCADNRAKSARVLGISRSTLYLKLADYGESDSSLTGD
ncbi:MAG: sigma-54 dependent transcriptional regulator, partial [Candidatus Hydrogenedentes bacterium]|nr:sigma-54 dependent transcriptional regulator [Candidatus Hydrogenedentota bacterium]